MAKVNLRRVRKQLEAFRKKAAPPVQKVLEEEIIKSIERGVSPVEKQGRFQRYSQVYRDQIRRGDFSDKRVSPVNLKLTGKLLGSYFSKIVGNKIIIGFDNFLADIHNRRGAGKSKVIRRMLPTESGEKFTKSITLRVNQSLRNLKKTFFK